MLINLDSLYAGMVEISVELRPAPSQALPAAMIRGQQDLEAARNADASAAYLAKSSAWWTSYKARVGPGARTRLVKLLAPGEDGVQRPTPSYIRPLQLGRSLSTPAQAVRFVALLHARQEGAAGVIARLNCPEAVETT